MAGCLFTPGEKFGPAGSSDRRSDIFVSAGSLWLGLGGRITAASKQQETAMMVTEGTSSREFPNSGMLLSLDCAAATVLQWHNLGQQLRRVGEYKPSLGWKPPFLLAVFHHVELQSAVSETRRILTRLLQSLTLSGKHKERVDITTTRADQCQNQRSLLKSQMHEYAMMSAAFTSDSPIRTRASRTEN
jgi:hypothetical protein